MATLIEVRHPSGALIAADQVRHDRSADGAAAVLRELAFVESIATPRGFSVASASASKEPGRDYPPQQGPRPGR